MSVMMGGRKAVGGFLLSGCESQKRAVGAQRTRLAEGSPQKRGNGRKYVPVK
jgi:hypothetical protein